MAEATLFEKSIAGRTGVSVPVSECLTPDELKIPVSMFRTTAPRLPEVSQLDVMRHYVRLSQKNHSIDTGFYPLGSCTMKYNPKVCDVVGQTSQFTQLHPETPDVCAQGTLGLLHRLQEYLKDLTGFSAVTLQPAAGAHGELTGMMMIRAWHQKQGNTHRTEVLIPDSAHGTNPATAAMCGFKVVEVPSGPDGLVDLNSLKASLSDKTAAIMLTNPNTLGLFEENILDITRLVHDAGGLCYYDGANLNAVMGQVRIADMGFDVMHINTHKTFATPHGGGGPGSGPVLVNDTLAPFLPVPVVTRHGDHYALDWNLPDTIGKVKLFWGNTEILLRAWAYMACYGLDGLRAVSDAAVLNANYIKTRLSPLYFVPYSQRCMHEFVMTSARQHEVNDHINTMALAKRLMDCGIHPPTVYFPLIVPEAMMIEPTETESLQTLDEFIAAMTRIDQECTTDPDLILSAPHNTPVVKVDEVRAARQLDVNFFSN